MHNPILVNKTSKMKTEDSDQANGLFFSRLILYFWELVVIFRKLYSAMDVSRFILLAIFIAELWLLYRKSHRSDQG